MSDKKVLVVEDEAEAREFLEMAFKCEGYELELVEDGDQAVDIVAERPGEFIAVFLDLLMPRKNGITALREIRSMTKDLPVFVTALAASPLHIVEAIKAGATDFIPKPLSHEDLRRHMAGVALGAHTHPVKRQPAECRSQGFFGSSRRMRDIQALVRRLSGSDAPVLIQGETGSGKEVLARDIHANSPRSNRVFLKLNCAALPSELIESELFGYERGAFTGAYQRKAGMFELADRGTILLDEIGDMDFKLQAKLLQVLQDKEFQRLGGKDTVRVDIRVMAATHRNLEAAIQNETFREDLYYRLNVITIKLPPLRERKEDVLSLAQGLLQKHAGEAPTPAITPAMHQAMLNYDWPGNIRELENMMRRYIILLDPLEFVGELSLRSARHRPRTVAGTASATVPTALPAPVPMEQQSVLEDVAKAKDLAEADAIVRALEATHWNRKRAAQMLNIDYKALLYKMKKLSIGEDGASSGVDGETKTGAAPKILQAGGG